MVKHRIPWHFFVRTNLRPNCAVTVKCSPVCYCATRHWRMSMTCHCLSFHVIVLQVLLRMCPAPVFTSSATGQSVQQVVCGVLGRWRAPPSSRWFVVFSGGEGLLHPAGGLWCSREVKGSSSWYWTVCLVPTYRVILLTKVCLIRERLHIWTRNSL